MSPNHVGFALILLAALFLVGKWLRVRVRWIQKIFLPSSIIAGFLALLAGPQVLGRVGEAAGVGWLADGGVFTPEILEVWAALPSLLISVVFATLFLGASIPGPRRVARLAGPQLSVGLAFGSGQYVVGLLLVIAVLGPLFGISPMAGALIEIGFEGGHGTAAGMRPVM
jgi:ESS family glutamate:Na+ symporter